MRPPLVLTLIAVLASGCTFGFGSPYVGEWRAHESTEFEVCVEDENRDCETTTEVHVRNPARSFWGFSTSYPMLGVSFPTLGSETATAFRAELQAEFLAGHGRFALGVRSGAIFDSTDDLFITTPIMLMAHVGLNERFSFYAGAGFSPYTVIQFDTADEGGESIRSNSLGRLLGGLQIVGSRQGATRIFYSFEGDAMSSSFEGTSYRSWGLTASIGLFL